LNLRKTIAMKRIIVILYILVGALNAYAFGVVAVIGISLGWNADAIIMSLVLAVSAILLMRAPFSAKNIDHLIIKFVKLMIVLYLCYLTFNLVASMIRDTYDASMLFVVIVLVITTSLLLFMSTARKKLMRIGLDAQMD